MLHQSKEYHTNFWNYLTIPNTATSQKLPRQLKDILTGSMIMPENSSKLLEETRHQFNPLRKLSTVIPLHLESYSILTLSDKPYTTWAKDSFNLELEDRQKVSSTTFRTSAYKVASFFKVDNALKEDAGFNLEHYLITSFDKAFAHEELNAMIHGDGNTTPKGLLKTATVGHQTKELTMDNIIRLYFSLGVEYRDNASWIMSDETAIKLRTLKDDSGNYLWQEDTLLGKPVVIVNALSDQSYPIAFGDFSYLWIFDKRLPSMKVLEESFYMKNETGYLAFETLDVLLIRPESIKLLNVEG